MKTAITYAIYLALLTLTNVTLFNTTFFTGAVIAFITLFIIVVVTHVKIIRVTVPINQDDGLDYPSYYWHGAEGAFYTNTIEEGEAILKLMKNIDKDSWIVSKLD